jgi:hypothetical protein
MTAATFEGWAVLELLGHRVRYGRISEVTAFGEPFCRIDMPTDPPTFELYAGKSVYGLRPASEESIRAYHRPRPALASGERVVDDDDWDERDILVHNLDEDGEPIEHPRSPAMDPLGVRR